MKHNWEYKRLGDICNIYQPKTIASSDLVENGEYDVFGANGLIGKYSSYNHEFPEILLTCRGATCGTINVSKPKSWINGNAMVIHSRSKSLLFDYLRYAMSSLDYSNIITGAAQPQITRHSLAPTNIPAPPIEVQEKIVAELDKINAVIEDCRELLRTLDTLAQSFFYDFFGNPITNPKGWKISKVSDSFETGSGGTPSKSNSDFWNSNDIPWIGSNLCQNNILHETDGKFISNLGLQNSSAKLLYPDTLLVALVGATIGKVALLKIPTSTNQNICFIKPNKGLANPVFLFYTLQGLYPLFLEIGNGNFKMANLSYIRGLPIILPPLALQEKFAERIEQIEAQKKAVEQTIAELQTLLDCRMDYWFN